MRRVLEVLVMAQTALLLLPFASSSTAAPDAPASTAAPVTAHRPRRLRPRARIRPQVHSADFHPPMEEPLDSEGRRYQPLCETTTRTRHLNSRRLEFHPPFYLERRCKRPTNAHGRGDAHPTKCGFGLLECVQRFRWIQLSRRRAGTRCWEPTTLRIPDGCDCMWPVHVFGPKTEL